MPPLSVLVVEDHPDLRASLASLIALWGYAVRTASTGALAIGNALEAPPDIAVIDLGLPGSMDGFAVAATLRASAAPNAYLIALTGRTLDLQEQGWCRERFDALVRKPDLEGLEAALAVTRHRSDA